MDDPKPGGCPRCAELEKKTAELTARVEKLEADLARAKKNSSTSSKPPSSDIVKPPKPAPKAAIFWAKLIIRFIGAAGDRAVSSRQTDLIIYGVI